jgi:iron complex outermembrane receptor protein
MSPAEGRRLRAGIAALILLCCAGLARRSDAATEARYRLELPTQELAASLRSLALASQLRLLYTSELVAGKAAPALRGDFTVREAFALLLQDSGLSFELVPPAVVLIRRASVPPTAQAAAPSAGSHGAAGPRARRSAAAPADDAALERLLAEVTVTARRRSEDVQQVPISLAVFSAETMQARSLDTTEAFNRYVPNVSIASGNFFGREQGSFRMRGLPDVGIYVDGIAHQEPFGLLGSIIEIERVEVLRGPQGTLFGKGSLGGAIQYVTRKPAPEFAARVNVTTGSFDRFDAIGVVDLPLTGTLFSKLTLAQLSRGGYLPSTTVHQSFGSQDDTVAEFELLWEPVDRFALQATARQQQTRTNGSPTTVWSLDPTCRAPTPNFTCLYNAIGLAIPQSWVYGRSRQFLTASAYLGPDLATRTTDFSAQADLDLGARWSLKGLGSYRRIRSVGYDDFDGIPFNTFDGKNLNTVLESTGELQLAFRGDRWSGTTGLYTYRDDLRFLRNNWFTNELQLAVNPANYAAVRSFLGNPPLPIPPFTPDVHQLTFSHAHGWAAFAEWTWRATEQFSLTLGARNNRDSSTSTQLVPRDPLPQLCCEPVLSVQAGDGPPLSRVGGDFSNFAPRISLQYRWSPDVMSYFTYAEGFNRGGGSITANGFVTYEPETLRNHELGIRSDLLDHHLRLNASAFFSLYDGVQLTQDVAFFNVTTNAGQGRARGLEIDGEWLPGARFSVSYGFGFLDTGYVHVPAGFQIRNGRAFPFAPRFSGTLGLQYERPLASGAALRLRADYGWQGDEQSNADDSRSFIPGYGLLSSRLTWRSPDRRWDLSLFGTNLTNEFYRLNGYTIAPLGIDTGTTGRPREWGLNASFRLD